MDKRTHLIEQLDQAREEMKSVLAQVEIEKEIYPEWTIKEVLAHITGWDDASIASLEAHLGGKEPSTAAALGINFYNAETVATRQALNFEQVKNEWEYAREQLKEIIRNLPAEKFDEPMLFTWGQSGTVTDLVKIFANHEQSHAEEIRDLLTDPV